MTTKTKKTFQAIYENGALKLRGRLPLRNHAKVRLIFDWPTSTAKRTRGLLKLPPRVVRLIAESADFSVLNV